VGTRDFVNYLSGGYCPVALLEGGDQEDVFVGGRGSNTIRGGNGDDLIYAHPADVILRNRILLTLVADVNNTPNPALSVFVNGKLAQGPVRVDATFQNRQTQRIAIDVSPSETVETIELVGDVAAYVDRTHYANIQIMGLSLMEEPVNFVRAQYSSASRILNDRSLALMNHNGRILFPRAAIPRPSTVFGSATDIVDGGGGTDTVVYRAAARNYTVTPLADGSYLVTTETTNEGPDRLWNVEYVRFSDKEIRLAP
jgi:Ca2+-binding RTX toxin-like protein